MNWDNKTDFQKYVEWREQEKFVNKQQNLQDYIKWDEEYKQEYWNKYVVTTWWYDERGTSLPIIMENLRKEYEWVDNNIDKFLPWTMKALEDEWFTWEIEDIFILDSQAKEYLNSIWYTQKESTKRKVMQIIWDKGEQEILWEQISFDELIERIWDLYYDSLSSFLNALSEYIYNKEIYSLLNEASDSIKKAWGYCKKPTLEFLERVEKSDNDDVKFKHTAEVKWLNLNNDELARSISHLQHYDLVTFLEKLSIKIQKDWEADKWRWRIKLANELFACANKLQQASKL